MNQSDPQKPSEHVHLIAICGTAMGTLAGMLQASGYRVTGSDDQVYPPMSTQLEKWGIEILKGFKPENLSPKPDWVVIGNAVSKNNPEVVSLLESGIPYLSMAEAIRRFFLSGKKSLVVSGTHGKTTTTSLLAWMLHSFSLDPGLLVGGIPKNFDSSFRLGKGDYFVIEGDEYDTAFFDKGPKFLHYQPHSVLLTGVEFDHADIYRDLPHLMSSFEKLIDLIPPEGNLVFCADNENALKLSLRSKCNVVSYGLKPECQVLADHVSFTGEGVDFDLVIQGEFYGRIHSPMSGRHNLQNLLGVIALSISLPEFSGRFQLDSWQRAVEQFQGVKRRQEIRGIVNGVTVMDDFAHHPTAVSETIQGIQKRYPGQKVWAVFEPRSNTSRRAIFQHDFAKALAHADEVLVAKVFMPEKVKEAPLLNVQEMVEEIIQSGKKAKGEISVDEIVHKLSLEAQSGDVILVMSNGGFEGIHEKLLQAFSENAS